MGVFDLIRAMFGLGGSEDRDGTKVSVEYDSDDPADTEAYRDEGDGAAESGPNAADESVETDAATPVEPGREADPEAESTAAAGTDAAGSTGSITETPDSEPEARAEPAEAEAGAAMPEHDEPEAAESAEDVGPASEKLDSDVESAEDVESEAEPEDTEPEDVEPAEDADPVDSVSGIGSAYAERLAAADVETVEQLLAADADKLADRTEISAKRIRRWQENAAED